MGLSALGRGTAIEENKVKASSADATPGFLEDKVDNDTMQVVADILKSVNDFHTDEATRDISITGAQVITGVGFQPKAILFIAVVGSPALAQASWGLVHDGGTTGLNIQDKDQETTNTYTHDSNNVITMVTGSSIQARASIASYDSDGFTLTWAVSGSPTGLCSFKFICLK